MKDPEPGTCRTSDRKCRAVAALVLPALLLTLWPRLACAHGATPPSLKGVAIPSVPGLVTGKTPVITNPRIAIALGKALFWDIQLGSDGTACATCHHQAGADGRLRNQWSPGQAGPAAETFANTGSGYPGGANRTLLRGDFPLHRLSNPYNFASPILFTTDDVVGSAGAYHGRYVSSPGESPYDDCERSSDGIFEVAGVGTRSVTSRNAPSVFNGVFFRRLFWDGRANNLFNGSSPYGQRDRDAGAWSWDGKTLHFSRLALPNSALASQAVAPPIDTKEMACAGRGFADLGRKLLGRRPLAFQDVHPSDSVLGRFRDRSGTGLRLSYDKLVKKAFHPRFWSAPAAVAGDAFGAPAGEGNPYTQAEANFALFLGLAIQAYESTLVSDDSPFDSPRDNLDIPTALNDQQRRGLALFTGFHCSECHSGPTLSGAVDGLASKITEVDRRPVRAADGRIVLGISDTGFLNTGVTALSQDAGLADSDPWGNPLSLANQYLLFLRDGVRPDSDPAKVRSCLMTVPFARSGFGIGAFGAGEMFPDPTGSSTCPDPADSRVPKPLAVEQELSMPNRGRLPDGTTGAFKTPSLRNVELTGPYMHNGGMATLEEVVDFYLRGGNFAHAGKDAQFLFSADFSEADRADLVTFLKSLTDERVRWERAPFDHPSLPLANGHVGNASAVDPDLMEFTGVARTSWEELPAVGAAGREEALGPLRAFDERLAP